MDASNRMPTVLNAEYIYSSDDDGVLLVGFADRQLEPTHYVLLQRQKRASANDVALGQDRVHITVDDQGRSMYGGIRAVDLQSKTLKIELEREAARQLGTEQEILVRFATTDAERAKLAPRLRDLFSDAADTTVIRLR